MLVVISDLYYENFTGANILGYSINTSRLVGFLGDEVKIGTFILGFLFPTAIYWFYRLFYSKKNNKLIYLNKFIYFLLIIFTLYILLPIGQRSVVVKLFFSLVFLFFFFPSISFKKKILSFFSFLFLFLIIIWNVNSLKSRYINQIFLSKSISSTLQPLATTNESQKEKINIIKIYKNSSYWKHHYASFEVFKSSPIFGVGNKNFRNSCHKYTEIVNKISFNNHHNSCSTHPHQIYYEFLSEHGVFGIFFIIILMSFYFKKFYYFKKNNNIFILGAITYFVYSFLPLIPSGSFFTSFNATLFWLNFCFLYFKTDRYN